MAATETAPFPVTEWGRRAYERHAEQLGDRSRFSAEDTRRDVEDIRAALAAVPAG